MHIAICDDEAAERTYLRLLVEEWAERRGVRVVLHVFDSAEAFLFAYDEERRFDVLLLDIQMKAMDGITLARRIRGGGRGYGENQLLQIIFITGFPDFMANGYEVSALHYLVKPVDEQKLSEVLDRAVARLRVSPRAIVFRQGAGYLRFLADDILYAEAFSHSVTLYTNDGSESFRMGISEMEEHLGEGFFRCHRSYVVGMKHVRRVTRTSMVLDNGVEVPLSRGLYDEANQAFIRSTMEG